MRVTRKTMAEHRAGILRQAGRLFRQHGIDGVAVISALSLAADPQAAARGLRAIIDAALAKRRPA